MRITCPSCSAEYEVPEARIAPGRQVRCAKCGEAWAPVELPAPPPPVVVEPVVVPEPRLPPEVVRSPVPPVVEPPKPAAEPVRRGGAVMCWLLSLALLVGAAYMAYAWRDSIMRAWPPSERAYALLGLVPRP